MESILKSMLQSIFQGGLHIDGDSMGHCTMNKVGGVMCIGLLGRPTTSMTRDIMNSLPKLYGHSPYLQWIIFYRTECTGVET
jgi:hypothetical protein